jgi:uncharacterized protein with HEPN domain
MDKHLKKYLKDILSSINAVDFHLQGKRNYFVYLENLTIQRAVEREIEIIGEAMSRILKLSPGINISSAKNIIGQRNLIIHAYDAISNEMIWQVVVNHLPLLKKEVIELLGEDS